MSRTYAQTSTDAQTRPTPGTALGLLTILLLAPLTGCAALMGDGPHRSAQLTAGNAPEPTVATVVLSCVTKALPYGSGDALNARFDALARAAMPVPPVHLSPEATKVLCGTVASSDFFHAWREWTPSAAATAVIRELARATGAKSIAMPAMRLYARCEQDTKTVRDSTGATIATIQENTQTCHMDITKSIGLFLFSADGSILYRSTRHAGSASSENLEPDMNEVLANIPATFSAPAGAAEPMEMGAAPAKAASAGVSGAPSTYAPPAAPQGVGPTDPQIDGALGELNAQAPGDCKKFVKAVCRNPSVPDLSRLQMCTGYVTMVNKLMQSNGTKAADSCKGLAKSAAP